MTLKKLLILATLRLAIPAFASGGSRPQSERPPPAEQPQPQIPPDNQPPVDYSLLNPPRLIRPSAWSPRRQRLPELGRIPGQRAFDLHANRRE